MLRLEPSSFPRPTQCKQPLDRSVAGLRQPSGCDLHCCGQSQRGGQGVQPSLLTMMEAVGHKAQAAGLTEADVDAELAAWNAERR